MTTLNPIAISFPTIGTVVDIDFMHDQIDIRRSHNERAFGFRSCACARTRDERSLSAAPFKNHQICATICETGIRDLDALSKDKAERIVEMWKQTRKIQD